MCTTIPHSSARTDRYAAAAVAYVLQPIEVSQAALKPRLADLTPLPLTTGEGNEEVTTKHAVIIIHKRVRVVLAPTL